MKSRTMIWTMLLLVLLFVAATGVVVTYSAKSLVPVSDGIIRPFWDDGKKREVLPGGVSIIISVNKKEDSSPTISLNNTVLRSELVWVPSTSRRGRQLFAAYLHTLERHVLLVYVAPDGQSCTAEAMIPALCTQWFVEIDNRSHDGPTVVHMGCDPADGRGL